MRMEAQRRNNGGDTIMDFRDPASARLARQAGLIALAAFGLNRKESCTELLL
jgi:hypothetical protein